MRPIRRTAILASLFFGLSAAAAVGADGQPIVSPYGQINYPAPAKKVAELLEPVFEDLPRAVNDRAAAPAKLADKAAQPAKSTYSEIGGASCGCGGASCGCGGASECGKKHHLRGLLHRPSGKGSCDSCK